MKLIRICKSEDSLAQGQCPAMYSAPEEPLKMVAQGTKPGADTAAHLRDVADDEAAVVLPTETVFRAVATVLADAGYPAAKADVESYLESLVTPK
ncbi:MAG: hypothetical protein J2P19_01790 [Pseudonocardia sp.]|nr:hypothetical protein [Pseudonocardia sp.]